MEKKAQDLLAKMRQDPSLRASSILDKSAHIREVDSKVMLENSRDMLKEANPQIGIWDANKAFGGDIADMGSNLINKGKRGWNWLADRSNQAQQSNSLFGGISSMPKFNMPKPVKPLTPQQRTTMSNAKPYFDKAIGTLGNPMGAIQKGVGAVANMVPKNYAPAPTPAAAPTPYKPPAHKVKTNLGVGEGSPFQSNMHEHYYNMQMRGVDPSSPEYAQNVRQTLLNTADRPNEMFGGSAGSGPAIAVGNQGNNTQLNPGALTLNSASANPEQQPQPTAPKAVNTTQYQAQDVGGQDKPLRLQNTQKQNISEQPEEQQGSLKDVIPQDPSIVPEGAKEDQSQQGYDGPWSMVDTRYYDDKDNIIKSYGGNTTQLNPYMGNYARSETRYLDDRGQVLHTTDQLPEGGVRAPGMQQQQQGQGFTMNPDNFTQQPGEGGFKPDGSQQQQGGLQRREMSDVPGNYGIQGNRGGAGGSGAGAGGQSGSGAPPAPTSYSGMGDTERAMAYLNNQDAELERKAKEVPDYSPDELYGGDRFFSKPGEPTLKPLPPSKRETSVMNAKSFFEKEKSILSNLANMKDKKARYAELGKIDSVNRLEGLKQAAQNSGYHDFADEIALYRETLEYKHGVQKYSQLDKESRKSFNNEMANRLKYGEMVPLDRIEPRDITGMSEENIYNMLEADGSKAVMAKIEEQYNQDRLDLGTVNRWHKIAKDFDDNGGMKSFKYMSDSEFHKRILDMSKGTGDSKNKYKTMELAYGKMSDERQSDFLKKLSYMKEIGLLEGSFGGEQVGKVVDKFMDKNAIKLTNGKYFPKPDQMEYNHWRRMSDQDKFDYYNKLKQEAYVTDADKNVTGKNQLASNFDNRMKSWEKTTKNQKNAKGRTEAPRGTYDEWVNTYNNTLDSIANKKVGLYNKEIDQLYLGGQPIRDQGFGTNQGIVMLMLMMAAMSSFN